MNLAQYLFKYNTIQYNKIYIYIWNFFLKIHKNRGKLYFMVINATVSFWLSFIADKCKLFCYNKEINVWEIACDTYVLHFSYLCNST